MSSAGMFSRYHLYKADVNWSAAPLIPCVYPLQPDLKKFGMEKLDADTVALLSRRAYDIAGATKGVSVYLNGSRLPVS